MSASEHVAMVPLGRARDSLLEEIIAAEGYQIIHLPSVAKAISRMNSDPCEAIALLLGEGTGAHAAALIQEAVEKAPQTKFLVIAPPRADRVGHALP